jgi:hypothetical protein
MFHTYKCFYKDYIKDFTLYEYKWYLYVKDVVVNLEKDYLIVFESKKKICNQYENVKIMN